VLTSLYDSVSIKKTDHEELLALVNSSPIIQNQLEHLASVWGEDCLSVLWKLLIATSGDIKFMFSDYLKADPPANITAAVSAIQKFSLPHNEDFRSLDEAVQKLYEHPAYPLLEHSFYLSHGIIRLKIVLDLADKIQQESLSFCDLGVGPGVIFSHILRNKKQWRGEALDISSSCVRYAEILLRKYAIPKERALIKQGDAQNLPFGEDCFDLIIATEILEHLPNPAEVLKSLRPMIKKNGHLIASVPINSPWGPHLVVFKNEEEVKNLFSESGFQIKEFVVFEIPHFSESLTFCLLQKK